MIPKRNIRFATLATAAIGALFPTALSAQDAHIQDPNTGIYARVHPDRYLQTYDERANMDEDPQRFIRFRGYAIRDCLPLATPPVARSLIIKTVIVNSFRMEDPVTSDAVSLFLGVNGCEENLFTFNRPGIGATSHNFEPGFVVPSGQTLWVIHSGTVGTEISGTGYSVRADWAQPSLDVSAQHYGDNGEEGEEGKGLGNGG
jgi:hypothetical protein